MGQRHSGRAERAGRAGHSRVGHGGAAAPTPRVLCFGTYDRSVGRNAVVLESLAAARVSVTECHVALWDDTSAKLRALGGASLLLAARQAVAWGRLLWQYRASEPVDVLLVGATAHLDLPLARILARAADCPLVFDPLVSALETVRDRRLLDGGRRLAALGAVERALLKLPDSVWLDTRTHAMALQSELGLDMDRVRVVPAGAPAAYRQAARPYQARRSTSQAPLRVVYFGQYIPLHGVPTVLRAAHLLIGRRDVRFTLVGRGQELHSAVRLASRLKLDNVRFVPAWLPVDLLCREYIATADVCLGIFGSQPKAARVVPFKVYSALASGRPVLSADTPAIREILRPGAEVHVVPADDPQALAAALVTLAGQPALRADLAAAGQRAYDERFSALALGRLMRQDLEALAARSQDYAGPRHAWRTEELSSLLQRLAPDGVVLDLGSGSGDLGERLSTSGRTVLALDRDLRRLRRARARALAGGRPAPLQVCADAAALPLAAGSLAGAAAGEVLEHLPDDAAALRQVADALVPGGALAASVPAGSRRWSAADAAVGHVRRYDREAVLRLLSGAGFRPLGVRGWGLPFGRLYDTCVQRPALGAGSGKLRGLVRRLGSGWLAGRFWRALFALDARVPAGERGSGWWVGARKLPTQGTVRHNSPSIRPARYRPGPSGEGATSEWDR